MTGSRLADEGADDDPPAKGDQYFADWAALQARVNEESAEAGTASNDLVAAAL
jgi:hypothetical protein